MLTEKLAQSLTEQQLKELIKKQGERANRNLKNIRAKGLTEYSGVMQAKIEPFLSKHGRKTKTGEKVFPTATRGKNKQQLIKQLLNIQYFNSRVGTATEVLKKAEKQADEQNIDVSDVVKLWRLYKYGYNTVGYRVDSDTLLTVIKNRIRAGQKDDSIKRAIRRAAQKADNATDMLTRFSAGGKWI